MTLRIKLSNKIHVPVTAIFHFSGISFSGLCDKIPNRFFFFLSPLNWICGLDTIDVKRGRKSKVGGFKSCAGRKALGFHGEAPRLSHFRTGVCGGTTTESGDWDGPAQGLSLTHLILDQLEQFPLFGFLPFTTGANYSTGTLPSRLGNVFFAHGLWDLMMSAQLPSMMGWWSCTNQDRWWLNSVRFSRDFQLNVFLGSSNADYWLLVAHCPADQPHSPLRNLDCNGRFVNKAELNAEFIKPVIICLFLYFQMHAK